MPEIIYSSNLAAKTVVCRESVNRRIHVVTYVSHSIDVGSSQAEMSHDLEAPVVSSQVEGSSAMLDKERKMK